ncbi:MAG: hypothetical protein Q7S55_01920 [Nanoarchaeota archaeon]|nr:hypothetical protein [Nanoarchaeota archaeon]
MSKKIVVLGILLLLFSSMVSALEYIPPIAVITQTMDNELNQAIGDLWVWLEVPENLPVPGQTFWVDLYVTPSNPSSSVRSLKLKLKPSNNKVKFTGGVSNLLDANGWSQIYANPTDGSLLLNHPDPISGNVLPSEKKLRLGRVEMLVSSQGSFGISLVKAESEAWYWFNTPDSNVMYILKQGNTRVLRNSHCVPNPAVCLNGINIPGKCGAVDNGCGKMVTCSACASDKICVSNACVAPVTQLPAASQPACLAVINTPQASDKVLLQAIGETLQYWGKPCATNMDCNAGAGYSCAGSPSTCSATELSILSPIFTAIKDWLFSKFST